MQFESFTDQLIQRVSGSSAHIVLAEGDDARCIAAAEWILSYTNVRAVTLLGPRPDIESSLSAPLRSDFISRLIITDHKDLELSELTRAHCARMLTAKGKNPSAAGLTELSQNPLYQAGALLANSKVTCALAGAKATTADVIRAALTTVGLAANNRTISGGFFMDRISSQRPETYYFADCGVVIDPTVGQLVDIAYASSQMWQQVTNGKPVVAFLSFSTKGSAKHESAEKMALACEAFCKTYPHIEADGELQFDAAFDKLIGERKAPGSRIPGRANVFIFPNLSAANIAYKLTQRLAGFAAYGPLLQGLDKPYSDLSRGATPEDIARSALINCLQS